MPKGKKKRKFWDVEMPLINHTTQLYGYSPEDLEGRIVKYDLTRLLKGKSRMLQSKVELKESEEGKKPYTVPQKITLLPNFIRRMVRKGTNSIDDSFSVECNDARVRLKPVLITRRKVSREVRKVLRNKTREELETYAKEKKSDKILKDILGNVIQKSLSLTLKKIYPLSLCEIRVVEIEERFSGDQDSVEDSEESGSEKDEESEEESGEKSSESEEKTESSNE